METNPACDFAKLVASRDPRRDAALRVRALPIEDPSFGLSIVVAVAEVDLSPQPPLELAYALKLLLGAVASFAAGALQQLGTHGVCGRPFSFGSERAALGSERHGHDARAGNIFSVLWRSGSSP